MGGHLKPMPRQPVASEARERLVSFYTIASRSALLTAISGLLFLRVTTELFKRRDMGASRRVSGISYPISYLTVSKKYTRRQIL